MKKDFYRGWSQVLAFTLFLNVFYSLDLIHQIELLQKQLTPTEEHCVAALDKCNAINEEKENDCVRAVRSIRKPTPIQCPAGSSNGGLKGIWDRLTK